MMLLRAMLCPGHCFSDSRPACMPAVALGYAYKTVRDSRTGLVNEALIILIVMLTTIAVSGALLPRLLLLLLPHTVLSAPA